MRMSLPKQVPLEELREKIIGDNHSSSDAIIASQFLEAMTSSFRNPEAMPSPFTDEMDVSMAFEELMEASSSEFDSLEESGYSSAEESSSQSSSSKDDSNSQSSRESYESTISSCSDSDESFESAGNVDNFPKNLEFTSEDMAIVSKFMTSPEVNPVIEALVDRAATMTSINWLSAHIPTCVLDDIGHEINRTNQSKGLALGNDSADSPFKTDGETVVSDLSVPHIFGTMIDESDSNEESRKPIPLHESAWSLQSDSKISTTGKGSESETRDLHIENVLRCPPQSSFLKEKGVHIKPAALVSDAIEHDAPLKKENNLNSEASNGRISKVRAHSPVFTKVTHKLAKANSASQSNADSSSGESITNGKRSQRYRSDSRQTPIKEEDEDVDEVVPSSSSDDDISISRRLALRALGIGVATKSTAASNHRSMNNGKFVETTAPKVFRDPFPDDNSNDGKRKVVTETLENGRRFSTKQTTSVGKRSIRTHKTLDLQLPYSYAYQCALLFVDISGFTKLATTLDPENLSKAINSYFQLIINEVTAHGGDVLKFAGDGVFVEWKASIPGSTPGLIGRKPLTLVECVCTAAVCSATIVAKCSDFPIFSYNSLGSGGQGSQVATLNVHCGLGVGQIVGIHVGDYDCRREYVILGDPIDQVCAAVTAASLGEVAISPQAMVTLSKSCTFHETVEASSIEKPLVIASTTTSFFHPNRGSSSQKKMITPPLSLSQIIEGWKTPSLKHFKKLMSLYVHPVVVANEFSKQSNPRLLSTVQERHREEAELRSVFVLFITPLIAVRVTGNIEIDRHLYQLLNNIMLVATRELNRFNGHLRQFIVDDKGVVLIATFGLRGSTFPNMVAERALPATITLHNALQNELGVQNQVGATIGNTYCGVVGGIKRHEYAVMGPSVNLAARLMSSPQNPGILVDNAVRIVADKSYAFNALPPVKAKGYSDPVPIFEPLSPLERSWGRVQPNFVGRKKEIMTLKGIARKIALSQSDSKLVYITGESGMGKSALVVHAIEHVRKLITATRRRIIITKHVSKESDLLVPFGIFRSILLNVLSYFKISQEERSCASYSSNGMNSIGWESLSGCSFAASEATGLSSSADRLSSICREINAPAAFEELVGHHLLGVENKGREICKVRSKGSNMKSLVTYMAKAFRRCTQEANLVMVALDDVHNMDEMSWRVVQELFDSTTNILFLCTSRPLSTYRLHVEKEFWDKLNTMYKEQDRFKVMTVERLQDSEIKSMIAKTLGLQEGDIVSTLLHDVLTQSNGMPHFANEILETMKRQRASDNRSFYDKTGEVSFASVGELILHRIDSFDASVRNVLNLAAVLGSSFEMKVLVAILRQMSEDEADFKTVIDNAKNTLDIAVDEGIFNVVHEGGDFSEDDNDDMQGDMMAFHCSFANHVNFDCDSAELTLAESTNPNLVYTFCHDIWRITLLNLMLDSRKRDMHLVIARTLEKHDGNNSNDYLSRMKLFSHWKASGKSIKAAALALSIGKSFEELGLQDQSIKVFHDALDMWKINGDDNYIPIECLDNLSVEDVECVINIYTALAKCQANIGRATESIVSYQSALRILQGSKVSDEMQDRSILFPIFSGLFAALQLGQIDQDEDCTYEQSLVARFVYETRVHGDPVHYARALAMQCEMLGRLRRYDAALEVQSQIASIYSPEDHSAAMCEYYSTDHAAQSFSLSALWQVQLGESSVALETCWFVFDNVFPEMEIKNVSNSFAIIYPLLWVLKENNFAAEARDNFIRFVVEPFDEYFSDGRSTLFLPVFDPILMVLTLVNHEDSEGLPEILGWALNEDNLRFGTVINCSLGNFGRCADSISAEICVLLAKRIHDSKQQAHLLNIANDLVCEALFIANENRLNVASEECRCMQNRLQEVRAELKL